MLSLINPLQVASRVLTNSQRIRPFPLTCRSASRLLDSNGNAHSRFKSSAALAVDDFDYADEADYSTKDYASAEIQRLKRIRNVGILAHVDAGKTTVTERMLALAGVVRSAGNVDDGNTVTDYLPAERERGITIQSAAISFDWGWHNNKPQHVDGGDFVQNDKVRVQLIDTPGHVDFSVEVNRSVAVLDGAVLVVDAVAGVQAQTETVWRAITRPSWNNHDDDEVDVKARKEHSHEPLPCLALINKMDKDGCHFGKAIQSLKAKLPGANPIATQIPLFRSGTSGVKSKMDDILVNAQLPSSIIAVEPGDVNSVQGEFVGVVDLIHMRAIIWPDIQGFASNVEHCVPTVVNLIDPESREPLYEDCQVTQQAIAARYDLVESLAEVDPRTEEYYLNDEEPSNAEIRTALRRATLAHKALPVMAGAALKGKGVEPLLDSVADLLPCPLDRMPPAINRLDGTDSSKGSKSPVPKISLGHALHPSLLALAFKVVHMKGRGGSGDGRVVFARVYSGALNDREQIQVISPPAPGEAPAPPREERVGGMLELAGGKFDNVEGGTVKSGDVCALVGLKTVVTGDTIVIAGSGRKSKKSKKESGPVCLAGVASPKPVVTVRLEAETSAEQKRLSEALALMAIEDPSLVVEETDSSTMLSGLGELHIEVTLDRLFREHALQVMVGPPTVAYRETIKESVESPGGLVDYDRTIGGTRLQGAVHLVLSPSKCEHKSTCVLLSDPVVTVGPKAREFLGLNQDLSEDELVHKSDVARALIRGCQGALRRGPHKSSPMANLVCHIEEVDAEGGLAALKAMPGALQAASANAVAVTIKEHDSSCVVLEPTMSVEITLPNELVGGVLSDLSGRRGTVGDVVVGEDIQAKSLIKGDVPLVEILGYATSLRSLTGGEGAFTAEYKGHSPC
eukprot:Nitzschia sp. Nitz4//scaffold283_size24287//19463//22192//NITZ4_008409-RA/size24287-processed-gene-0.9-mRNA-1//-1//CDS//3329545666//6420//frame0